MENKQNLGIKVFYYYLSKNILVGFFLLVISTIIASVKTSIISKLSFLFAPETSLKIANTLVTTLFIITLLTIGISVLLSWLKYKNYSFIVGENTFTIQTGILNKNEISIPYHQIQNISIEQSFSNRLMGICSLYILTAGNDENDKEGEAGANFKVIDFNVAQKLKETVLQKTGIKA